MDSTLYGINSRQLLLVIFWSFFLVSFFGFLVRVLLEFTIKDWAVSTPHSGEKSAINVGSQGLNPDGIVAASKLEATTALRYLILLNLVIWVS